MENTMETTIVYCGYIGIMENKMETTDGYVSKRDFAHAPVILIIVYVG